MSDHNQERMRAHQQKQRQEQVLYEFPLSERYVVKIGEITGFDETMVLKLLGDKFKMTGAGAMLYRNAMIGRSIKFVKNLKPLNEAGQPDTTIEPTWVELAPKDAEAFLNSLKGKEKATLEAGYAEVNEISEEERAAVKNLVTPTMES